jgi:hypothetical protein
VTSTPHRPLLFLGSIVHYQKEKRNNAAFSMSHEVPFLSSSSPLPSSPAQVPIASSPTKAPLPTLESSPAQNATTQLAPDSSSPSKCASSPSKPEVNQKHSQLSNRVSSQGIPHTHSLIGGSLQVTQSTTSDSQSDHSSTPLIAMSSAMHTPINELRCSPAPAHDSESLPKSFYTNRTSDDFGEVSGSLKRRQVDEVCSLLRVTNRLYSHYPTG